jgi:hypothetical protein
VGHKFHNIVFFLFKTLHLSERGGNMRLFKVVFMAFLVISVVSMHAIGQTFDLNFIEVTNDGSSYDVKVQIKSNTSTFGLGSSNLVFTYSTSVLASPSLLAAYNFNTGFYTLGVTQPVTGRVSINIDYGGGSGSGTTVQSSYMDVATIHFTTTDPTGNSNLQWRTVTPNRTNVFKDDQATEVPAGTLNNLNSNPLPIQLASFAATVVRNNDVEVAWKTVSETNNYGFEVYRKRNEGGEWTKLGFIEGHGTMLAEHSYTYLDKSVGFGKYYYQIKQVDLDGKSETYPEMTVVVGVAPDQFVLAQNYPNPFNPTTTIEFALPKETHVSLEVYNAIGQRVATLVDKTKPMGIYVVPFNASALASGTYFYRLTTKEVTFIKKMMILK